MPTLRWLPALQPQAWRLGALALDSAAFRSRMQGGGAVSVHALLPGPPVPKARPRASQRGGFYTPQATKDAEQTIAEHIIVQNRDAGLDAKTRFRLDVHFYCGHRGDLDNFVKTVADGITKSGVVWRDDSQVDALYAIRMDPDAQGPRTELWVRSL